MNTYDIRSEYVDLPRAQIERAKYADGSLAVRATSGCVEEILSINLSARGAQSPGQHEFYCKDYSEFVGVPDALERCGLAVKVRPIGIGPFCSPGWLMKLTAEAGS